MTALTARATGGLTADQLIADIWAKRVEGIIHQVQHELEDYREIGNLYEHISDDYHGRFLIELIQNASDQAHLAGLVESTVHVVRTGDRLYVANQGLVFNPKGLDRMTKLGLSDKDPSKAIGNKGVGFKSVRQVSSRAEVFSAPDVGSTFMVAGGLRFGLRLSGSLAPAELEHLQDLVASVMARDLGSEREQSSIQVEDVLAALTRTPPFRFPTALGEDALGRALQDMGSDIGSRAQTVVVLELLRDDTVTEVVNRAIDELVERGGASVLFLPAVTTIRLDDRVRERLVRISRQTLLTERRGQVAYSRARTAVQSPTGTTHRDWHKVDRTLGADGNDAGAAESTAIHDAARLLPGEGWSEVRTATISVALPTGDATEPEGAPLPPEGLFVIGLPTRKPTGMPFWIDGRFHGRISRTEIDLEQTHYNALLFAGAKKLVTELLDILRSASGHLERRLVTRAMNTSTGDLATWMRSKEGPASGEVVLMSDGQGFQRPAYLKLPRADDVEFVLRLSGEDTTLLGQYGYALPELPLLRDARELLESLGARGPSGRSDSRLLSRVDELSLLERGALAIRDAGPVAWEQFLVDVLDRFDGAQLADQGILPISEAQLARPTERIFYAPRDETEEEVLSIPPQVAYDLRFLDESAVPMRAGPRALTAIGRRIGEDGVGLVRPPRIQRLIPDGIAPRLESLATEGRHEAALALLAQVIEWLPRVGEDDLATATRSVRVPCTSADGAWVWRNAHEVYFGRGWLGESPTELHREELIAKAYSDPPGRLVVAWNEFDSVTRMHDRMWWRDGLAQLGVNTVPRIISIEALGRSADLRAWDYTLQVNFAPLPGGLPPGAERYWRTYLARLASGTRSASYSRGQFVVRRVIWIDGLEDDSARDAVFELMLLEPSRFFRATATSIVRTPQLDGAIPAPAFWLDVIRSEDWPIVPTARHGAARPSKSWIIGGDGARGPGYAELREVRREFSQAGELLGALGVANLASPSVDRAISGLHDIATAITAATKSTALRDLEILSQKLYEGLSRACDQADIDLAPLVAQPIPARVAGAPAAIDLQTVDSIYVDDDPARGQFVPSDSAHPFLPVPPRSAIAGLVRELGRVLGPDRVVRTSGAKIDTGFEPAGEERSLVEFLGPAITRDLALLFAYGRRKEADPAGEAFRSTWDTFTRTRLRRGAFPAGGRAFSHTSFFDADDRAGPRLDVAADDAEAVIPLLWTIFGPDARDPLIAYAADLSSGQRERFFLERQIGDLERREVEDAIGMGLAANFETVRDVLYAVWARGRLTRSLAEFVSEWASRSSVDDRARWLGIDREALLALLQDSDDASRIRVLDSARLSVAQWQSARSVLGLPPHIFAETGREYVLARDAIVWGLASVAAHSPGVALDQARTALEEIRAFMPADEVMLKPSLTSEDIRDLAVRASDVLQRVTGVDVLISRLKDIADSSPLRAADVTVQYASRREIGQFRDYSEAQRTQWAQQTLDNLIKVAAALAQRRGLAFDETPIRAEPRVVALSSGWWASDFALLAAVETATRRFAADEIATALVTANAFRDPPHDWRRLWTRFDELGPLPVEAAPAPLPPVKVGSLSLTFDEIARDLRDLGPDGRVARQLIAAVDDQPPFASLRQIERASAALPAKRTRRAPGERPVRAAKPPRAETNADRDLNGLLGEVFVFEEFRRHLPDFDEKAWVSENRVRYIPSSVGASDAEGFDFGYRDTAGLLTGRSDSPICHIEVKATSGDGTDPFPITSPEWEHAKQCHDTRRALYVIVRVGEVRSERPRITDVLTDPVDLWHRGTLVVDAQNFWVHTGERVPSPNQAPSPH